MSWLICHKLVQQDLVLSFHGRTTVFAHSQGYLAWNLHRDSINSASTTSGCSERLDWHAYLALTIYPKNIWQTINVYKKDFKLLAANANSHKPSLEVRGQKEKKGLFAHQLLH